MTVWKRYHRIFVDEVQPWLKVIEKWRQKESLPGFPFPTDFIAQKVVNAAFAAGIAYPQDIAQRRRHVLRELCRSVDHARDAVKWAIPRVQAELQPVLSPRRELDLLITAAVCEKLNERASLYSFVEPSRSNFSEFIWPGVKNALADLFKGFAMIAGE